MDKRNQKVVEIKNSLLQLNPPLTETICPTLTQFFTILQDWCDNDTIYHGIINLPEINKDIVYQLETPKNTVVKLTEPGKVKIDSVPYIKDKNTGRNDECQCGSGKKYKKCCLK